MRLMTAILTAAALWSCSADYDPPFEDMGETVDVVLKTDLGKVHIELFTEKAPESSRDFLYYVDEGLYAGQGFYRTVHAENDSREMGMSLVQGGTLDLAPYTPFIDHESTDMTGLSNIVGSLALARNEPGTASAAYFFINLGDNRFLDYGGERNPDGQGYAVFGQVTKGMKVLEKIQAQKTYSQETADGLPAEFPLEPEQTLFNPVFIKEAKRK